MEYVFEAGQLSPKEFITVKTVLKKYGIDSFSALKVRSVYKITTAKGVFCLKRMRHGRYKVKNGFMLIKHLRSNNFNFTAKYYKTINDKYYVSMHDYIFYLTEWINGSECDLSYIDNAINCAKLLAYFHKAVGNVDIKNLKLETKFINWPILLKKAAENLNFYKQIIMQKRILGEFDNEYLKYIDIHYNRIIKAITLLDISDYNILIKEAFDKHSICHNSFYYQNIIKTDNDYYIIDLDSIVIDLQIIDLAHFIRRLMCKHEYDWDFQKAKMLIEAYSSIKPICYAEFQVMTAMLIYPHKFIKLGKKFYIKNKHWPDGKYLRKLKRIIKASDKEMEFIEEFTHYIECEKNFILKDANNVR